MQFFYYAYVKQIFFYFPLSKIKKTEIKKAEFCCIVIM